MKVYSFLDTVFLVNGVEISGWAEGDDVVMLIQPAGISGRQDVIEDGARAVWVNAELCR